MKYALVFHTTHQTMLAEEALSLSGFFFDTLPLPKDIKAGCTLALSVKEADVAGIVALLRNESIVIEGLYAVTGDGWRKEALAEARIAQYYLDCNATTAVAPEVMNAMLPFIEDEFGNPSSIHSYGRMARSAIDQAREHVAALVGADPTEIVFTGCGSEANNLAIKGMAFARLGAKGHIITSAIEHASVLNVCRYLETLGFDVTCLPVDGCGLIDPAELERAIRHDTFLISIQWANNEVGTIQPVAAIGEIARKRKVLFHSDAVQAAAKVIVDAGEVPVDMMTISAHKFCGPKGVGALYIKHPNRAVPLVHGGKHERGMRAGTENVPGIVGIGAASMLAMERLGEYPAQMSGLRDLLQREIAAGVSGVALNGHPEERLPNTLNLSFPGVDGESLLINLDLDGIKASTGAACSSGSVAASHVLQAMRVPEDRIKGSIRFSLGFGMTEEDVGRVAKTVVEVVNRMKK